MKRKFSILCSTLALLSPLHAAQVWFASSLGGGHITSTGSPLKGDTIVELGAFAPGFTPTAANTAQWRTNWVSAARSLYDEQNGFYSGIFTLNSNAAPFGTSQQGWIWVYNRSGEWCLYSKPSWTWPSTAGDNILAPSEWSVEDASVVVVGAAAAGTNEIVTAKVTDGASPSVTFEQWVAMMFGTNPALASGDNDGDGISNFAEYAFGSRADQAGSVPGNASIAFEDNGQKYLAVGVEKGWITGVNFSAELTQDLSLWDGSAASIVIVKNDANGFIARDSQPMGAREKSFIRLNATK